MSLWCFPWDYVFAGKSVTILPVFTLNVLLFSGISWSGSYNTDSHFINVLVRFGETLGLYLYSLCSASSNERKLNAFSVRDHGSFFFILTVLILLPTWLRKESRHGQTRHLPSLSRIFRPWLLNSLSFCPTCEMIDKRWFISTKISSGIEELISRLRSFWPH